MKWNWGKGLVLGMLSFIAFILYFVITMSTDKKYSHDLVTEEYYAKEIAYQKEIDAETNMRNLTQTIKSRKVTAGWEITFPTTFEPSKIEGEVLLYRPSNEKLDFQLPLDLSNPTLIIPDNRFIAGRWNITISWSYDEKPYMYKEEIVY